MARLKWSVATLRVSGDDLHPDDVTACLGVRPSMSFARGDEIARKRAPVRTAEFGLWSLDAPETKPADLDSQVSVLLEPLTTDLDVWRRLAEGFKVDLFCGWFMEGINEGLSVDPATLRMLVERHIVLDLDIYAG